MDSIFVQDVIAGFTRHGSRFSLSCDLVGKAKGVRSQIKPNIEDIDDIITALENQKKILERAAVASQSLMPS